MYSKHSTAHEDVPKGEGKEGRFVNLVDDTHQRR